MPNDNDLVTPAYVSLQTLWTLVKRLKDTTLPPVIDNSVLTGMAGGTQSQLKTSLRFLELTDSQGRVSPTFRGLVEAFGTDDWKETWGKVVTTAYLDIVRDIDVDSATHQQLLDAFRTKAGAKGSILTKAVRFYIGALDQAGITYSPFFKAKGASAASSPAAAGGSKKAKKRAPRRGAKEDDPQRKLPDDWKRFELPLPGLERVASLELPVALTGHGWKIVRDFIEGFYAPMWDEEESK